MAPDTGAYINEVSTLPFPLFRLPFSPHPLPFHFTLFCYGKLTNQAYTYQKDWQWTFWGDNYDRLLEIKRAVDPGDVLWCHPCVGSEGWEVVEGRLCRVGWWT
ncbi:BBE domain-containing protein [Candidatus Bathyarchaeota archaeon]|nr:BBE domain-containing protein [Candidatus Bathyarchaeota archaeon]